MALILAMGTYGAGYVRVLSEHLFSAKWATESGVKSALYYHHYDGDLYHLNWCAATYAQIGVFAPILLVTLRIIQGWGQARKFPVPARCWRNMHQR